MLAVFAHPDDPEFTSGGTLALWRRAGAEIGYLICTAGDKGSEDRAMSGALLGHLRESEQRSAGNALGVSEYEFLGHEDGGLQHTLALRKQIVRALRRFRPDTVVCFDPVTRYVGEWYVQHPDHYLSGEAALAAIYPAARNARTFPDLLDEGLEPHVVQQIYLTGANSPNRWIDVESTIDLKIEAMLRHTSQTGDADDTAAFLRLLAAETGKQARPGPLRFAEAFRYLNSSGG